jgi:transcription elongation factor Elf1
MEDKISINCECGEEIKVTLKQMNPGSFITCPACGIQMKFEGDNIPKELDSLEKKIFKMFDNFK